jgi:chitodextrinase
MPVTVVALAAGLYTLNGVAQANGAADSASATIVFLNGPPLVDAGPHQSVRVNDVVSFSGSASDPDGDALASIAWNFGDGATASGSLTPSHAYATAGVYTVTLTVTDSRSAANSDSLRVTVAANRAPTVDAGSDQTVRVNDTVNFSGSASDPDGDALTSIAWSFGDGATASGSLTPSHAYAAARRLHRHAHCDRQPQRGKFG